MSGAARRLTQAQLNRLAACVNHDLPASEPDLRGARAQAADALHVVAEAFGLDATHALEHD